MMNGYLGEELVDVKDTVFKKYKAADWALYYIQQYGQIDGEHHKQWVLDQVARSLNKAPITIKKASWKGGHSEYRISVGTSPTYEEWVESCLERNEEGEPQYSYDIGSPP